MTKSRILKEFLEKYHNADIDSVTTASILREYFKENYGITVEGNSASAVLSNVMQQVDELPGTDVCDCATVCEMADIIRDRILHQYQDLANALENGEGYIVLYDYHRSMETVVYPVVICALIEQTDVDSADIIFDYQQYKIRVSVTLSGGEGAITNVDVRDYKTGEPVTCE